MFISLVPLPTVVTCTHVLVYSFLGNNESVEATGVVYL